MPLPVSDCESLEPRPVGVPEPSVCWGAGPVLPRCRCICGGPPGGARTGVWERRLPQSGTEPASGIVAYCSPAPHRITLRQRHPSGRWEVGLQAKGTTLLTQDPGVPTLRLTSQRAPPSPATCPWTAALGAPAVGFPQCEAEGSGCWHLRQGRRGCHLVLGKLCVCLCVFG